MSEARIRVLDAGYVPFPPFEKWRGETNVDTVRWERYSSALTSRPEHSSRDLLERALNVAKRAAAIDTGAIEGLYETNRGFTYSVAVETAAWEAQFAGETDFVRSLFEAQLAAYDYVLTLATEAQPISEAALRALHERICEAQSQYKVRLPTGTQEQDLPKGKYKAHPNHVTTQSGFEHVYAPVEMTAPEMARLVKELHSESFKSAHPASQAAYAHYCLVAIHPFADGNGRVARALASVFTYKSISMPIVIFTEEKKAYWAALEAADHGKYQVFLDFITARCLDTIELVEGSLRAASAPDLEESINAIQRMYITKGGYTYEDVDKGGANLMTALHTALMEYKERIHTPRVSVQISMEGNVHYAVPTKYRVPRSGGGSMLHMTFSSPYPAESKISFSYTLALPQDAAGEDDIQLIRQQNQGDLGVFTARVDQVIPAITGALQIKINQFAEYLLKITIAELKYLATRAIEKHR